MTILITGGAGFIGSQVAVVLLEEGYEVLILDNFSNSSPETLNHIAEIAKQTPLFIKGDIRDKELLDTLFSAHNVRAVIHCAGLKSVKESMEEPEKYLDVNVRGTRTILSAMNEAGVLNILFSSSATVYGKPSSLPIKESHPLAPESPYGLSKLQAEAELRALCLKEPKWGAISLRFFNPIGAHPSGLLGESPLGIPNNLMPYLVRVSNGDYSHLNVYGGKYPTKDGTGVRDYIHVQDIAQAHLKALERLLKGNRGWDVFNLSTGAGHSVLELVKAVERSSGLRVPYQLQPPRAGDVAQVWGDASKAHRVLKWKPQFSLDEMCTHSLQFALQVNNPTPKVI